MWSWPWTWVLDSLHGALAVIRGKTAVSRVAMATKVNTHSPTLLVRCRNGEVLDVSLDDLTPYGDIDSRDGMRAVEAVDSR